MKKILITHILLLLAFAAISQRRCGTMEYQQFLNDNNYAHEVMRSIVEQNVETYRTTGDTLSDTTIITIPVVFHLIGNSVINSVTINDINDQIEILNDDYSRKPATNGYGNGVDTKIRFCLATKDAFGNPTTGKIPITGNYPSWNMEVPNNNSRSDSSLKALSHWPPTKYLNLYVVEAIYDNTPPPYDSTVYGYSTFPWEMLADPEKDGVVIGKAYFGYTQTLNLDLGRTATHEVGHWLGLYHPFQNGENDDEQPCYNSDPHENGDLVWDTPPVNFSLRNYNICDTTTNTCHSDNPDIRDQVENYMDYGSDACFSMFTKGQADRIRMILETSRPYAGYVSCFPSCSDSIQNGDETGVDCGGSSCNPCMGTGGGSSSGGGATFSGCGNGNQDKGYDLTMVGCHAVSFAINNRTTDHVVNVCSSNIILTAYNYQTSQQGNNVYWLYKIKSSGKYCTKTDNMWQAAEKTYVGNFSCYCVWLSLFIAIQECDENLSLIGSEYIEEKYFYDSNLATYSELNVSQPINLNQHLPTGFQFQDDKYYKVKIASFLHGSDVFPWVEHSGYIRTYKDTLFVINKPNVTQHQFADYIEIKNSTVPVMVSMNDTNNIKVVAISQIKITADNTGHTSLKNGKYYIDTTLNCNNLPQYRTAGLGYNTENTNVYSNTSSAAGSNTKTKNDINSVTTDWVKVFPNPAQNNITVQFQNINTAAIVTLYNVSGVLILSEKINRGEQNHQIDISAFTRGFYIVEIQSENKQIKRVKIVKE